MAWSPPDFMVVEKLLEFHLPGDAVGSEWVRVQCASKAAHGCGVHGDKFLRGLDLYVRRLGFADLNSSLSIGLDDTAIQSIRAELGLPLRLQGAKSPMLDARGFILVTDHGVLVLHLLFRIWGHGDIDYYLVYDAMDQSLYMIPGIPSCVEATYTMAPVPARPAGCVGHELALAARTFWPSDIVRGRLCLSTPATRADASSGAGGPWTIKGHGFPEFRQGFSVDVMFSVADKVFWADLSRGVAYSDLRQGGSVVDVVFVKLPDGYQIDFLNLPVDANIDPPKMTRTMGCVEGGSIKFVCIDRGMTHNPGADMVVKVWTLDLDHQQWKEEEDLTCPWKELWTQACLMNPGLRGMHQVPLQPQYPVLMAGGALGLLLPKARHKLAMSPRMKPDYICSFDMFTKRCLSLRQVRGYHLSSPVVLPYQFFKNCYPAPKRKPPTHKRKQPSIISAEMPMSNLEVAQ